MPATNHPDGPRAVTNSPRHLNVSSHEHDGDEDVFEDAVESLSGSENEYEDARSTLTDQSDDGHGEDDLGAIQEVDNSEDSDDDLVVESAPKLTTTSDVVRKLGPTYQARVNGVACSLSSAHDFTAFEEEVLAVAPAGEKDDLIWYKCTFTKQDLLIQDFSFNKYLYKLINGWVATTDGTVDLAVLTQWESFRSPGSPPATPKSRVSPAPLDNDPSMAEVVEVAEDPFKWRPSGARIIGGAGTEDSPFLISSVEGTPTGVRISPAPESAMTLQRSATPPGPRTTAPRSLPTSPRGLGKRRRGSPRFSPSQRQQIADHVLGSREAPIEL